MLMQLEQFVAHTLQTALSADSMENTHPISVPVHNPSQITEIFDSISYDKVWSVIRYSYFGYICEYYSC